MLAQYTEGIIQRIENNNIFLVDFMDTRYVAETPILLCEEFSNLKNNILQLKNNNAEEFGQIDIEQVRIVQKHWYIFTNEYIKESDFINDFARLIRKLIKAFGVHLVCETNSPAGNNPKINSDLSIRHIDTDNNGVPLVIIEGKRAYGISKCDQDIQVASYYAHYFRGTLEEKHGDMRVANSAWPTLLITRVRGHFRMMGAYTLIRSISNGEDGGKEKIFHLVESLETFDVLLSNFVQVTYMFMVLLQSVEKLHAFRSECKNLRYPIYVPPLVDEAYYMYPKKLVYISTKKVYKFTKTYCEAAHNFAFSLGIAPELVSCRLLKSGYYFLEMEYIPRTQKEEFNIEEWQNFEQNMIIFNERFVHGDIRKDNVIQQSDGKYLLVDFDWSGPIDKLPRYPFSRNHQDIRWPKDSKPGGVIYPQHDQFMLRKLKKKLSQIC